MGLEELLNDDGPSHVSVTTGEGRQTVDVYGRTGGDAVLAGNLVCIVHSGRMTGIVEGHVVSCPTTNDLLADLLLRAYDTAEGPHQIAEAITALRKLQGPGERRLLRVLSNRPGLAALRQRVHQELTGEPPCP